MLLCEEMLERMALFSSERKKDEEHYDRGLQSHEGPWLAVLKQNWKHSVKVPRILFE